MAPRRYMAPPIEATSGTRQRHRTQVRGTPRLNRAMLLITVTQSLRYVR